MSIEATLDHAKLIAIAVRRLRLLEDGASLLYKVGEPDTLLACDSISDTLSPLEALILHPEMPIPYPTTYRRLPIADAKRLTVAYIERCAEFICEQS